MLGHTLDLLIARDLSRMLAMLLLLLIPVSRTSAAIILVTTSPLSLH